MVDTSRRSSFSAVLVSTLLSLVTGWSIDPVAGVVAALARVVFGDAAFFMEGRRVAAAGASALVLWGPSMRDRQLSTQLVRPLTLISE